MRKMGIALGILFIFLGSVIIYESIDYSPLKKEYALKRKEITNNKLSEELGIFSESELKNYPNAIRKYFRVCGFINKPKMAYSIANYKDVNFVLNTGQKPLKISYERVNDGTDPNVLAFIDTSFYKIPFQGIDSFYNGEGSMKGILGKQIPLFNESGEDFYTGSLVTYLSESLLVPTSVFRDFISWKEIDNQTVEGKLTYAEYEVSGLFHFNKSGELEKFSTTDRVAIDSSGKKTHAPWSAVYKEYVSENGMRHPSHLQAIWHYETGDSVYFDGKMASLSYGYK